MDIMMYISMDKMVVRFRNVCLFSLLKCVCVCPSVRMFVCLYVSLSVSLSATFFLFVLTFVWIFGCQYVGLSLCFSVIFLSVFMLSVWDIAILCLFDCISVGKSVCLFACRSIFVSLLLTSESCQVVSIYFSVCMYCIS